MERILLSTYRLKILDENKNEQVLNYFNGKDDFFDFFQNFSKHILTNLVKSTNEKETTVVHLTMDSLPIIEKQDRVIYGYFLSGVSGDTYVIKDTNTGDHLIDVNKEDGAFRHVFFYIVMPFNKNYAYLILQRKSKFGIKGALLKSLNSQIKEKGYTKYRLEINNLLHSSVYRKMIDNGKLKKIDFIKRKLPRTIEEYYSNGELLSESKGTLRTSMISSSGLPDTYKKFIDRLYSNDNSTMEIEGIDDDFDEIEFELELNGKKKTFYLQNRTRVQPDVDVTSSLKFKDNKPTIESLVTQSKELIDDMMDIKPLYA